MVVLFALVLLVVVFAGVMLECAALASGILALSPVRLLLLLCWLLCWALVRMWMLVLFMIRLLLHSKVVLF